MKHCAIEGCEKNVKSRGWCSAHYEAWRRWGTPTPRKPTIAERLDAQTEVNRESDCWEWTGHRTAGGYGAISYEGREQYVHRLSYVRHVGPIGDGLVLDHLCRNERCLNPAHLEAVTHRENVTRGIRQRWWEHRARRDAA